MNLSPCGLCGPKTPPGQWLWPQNSPCLALLSPLNGMDSLMRYETLLGRGVPCSRALAWRCKIPVRPTVWRNCESFREIALRECQPKVIALIGKDVIKHEIYRGRKCPDLRLAPGMLVSAFQKEIPYLLLPDWDEEGFAWDNARKKCANALLKSSLPPSR